MKKCILTVLVSVLLLVSLSGCGKKETVLFWDNATFNAFSDEKTEMFLINETSDVKMVFSGEIEEGSLEVSIYNRDTNDIIYENDSLKYEEEINISLEKGNYIYYLKISGTNGRFYHKGVIEEKE